MKRLLTLLLMFLSLSAFAQVDTVYSLNERLIKQNLKSSSNQYLVFIQRKNDPRMTFTFVWSRDVRFINKGGKDLIEIDQKWYGSDTTRNRKVYSLLDAHDFSPVYHRTVLNRSVEAFDFYRDKVVGSDSVANNTKKDFTLVLEKPLLNWELDMEIFPLLDLKAGKSFFISYYHPGGKTPPKLYEYRVVGEENVKIVNGAKVPCWKLRIDYDAKSWAIFYISKKEREVLKMEEDFGAGVRYKVKLSNEIAIK